MSNNTLMHRRAPLVLLTFCLVTVTALAFATNKTVVAAGGVQLYVDSVNGNDANPGASPDSPGQSFAPLYRYSLQPGDTVNLARGSSWNTGLRIERSGSEDAPITVRPYGSGPAPALSNLNHEGTGRDRSVYVAANWIVIEGLFFHDALSAGVWLSNGASHNIVRGCEAYKTGAGVTISGQYNLVTANYFHDLVMESNVPGSNYGAVGVWLRNPFNEVSYNVFVNCRAPSTDFGYDGGAVELYGVADGSYVHHNYVQDCRGFMEVGGPNARGSARDVLVNYNLVVDSGRLLGFHIGGDEASVVESFRFEHNTVVDISSASVWSLNYFMDGTLSPTALAVRNNIFCVADFEQLTNSDVYTHDHNLYYLLNPSTRLSFTLADSELQANPVFVGLDATDLRLGATSPAIGSGRETDGSPSDLGALPSGRPPTLVGGLPR